MILFLEPTWTVLDKNTELAQCSRSKHYKDQESRSVKFVGDMALVITIADIEPQVRSVNSYYLIVYVIIIITFTLVAIRERR